jgi:hypothetical protein
MAPWHFPPVALTRRTVGIAGAGWNAVAGDHEEVYGDFLLRTSSLKPNWKVARIHADSLVRKRGVLHCIGIGLPGNINVTPLLRAAQGG